MSSAFPVPSRFALRVLRNLALGTTCTVALGAGLLTTEERRRRIAFATEIRDNGKRIKSVRNYHSEATTSLYDLEGRANDSGHNIASVFFYRPESRSPQSNHGSKDHKKTFNKRKAWRDETISMQVPGPPKSQYETMQHDIISTQVQRPVEEVLDTIPTGPSGSEKTESTLEWRSMGSFKVADVESASRRLASDIVRLVGDGEQLSRIHAATSRLLEALADGRRVIHDTLVDAIAILLASCRRHQHFEAVERIVVAVLDQGPLSRAHFDRLDPIEVITRLLEPQMDQDTGATRVSEICVRKAASIYMTRFKEEPTTLTVELYQVGFKLCTIACDLKLYRSVIKIHRYLVKHGSRPSQTAAQLILSEYSLKEYNVTAKHFQKYYQRADSVSQFVEIVQIVLDSISRISCIKTDIGAGVFLRIAHHARDWRSQGQDYFIPSKWLLQIVGHHWRTEKNISSTRALFDRIEPFVDLIAAPQMAYAAIIQCCVEAGQASEAEMYLKRFQKAYPDDVVGIRIRGHFALAKAREEDWQSVREIFAMLQANHGNQNETTGAIYMPILKLYAEGHSTNETEAFVQLFVEQYGVPITYFMSTFMLDLYGKAKEIEALGRWVEYTISISPKLFDANTFNILLRHCRKRWSFTFEQLRQMFTRILKIGGLRELGLVNDDTYDSLMRIAIAESDGDPRKLKGILNAEHCSQISRRRSCYNDGRALQIHMSQAIAYGRPMLALKTWNRAKLKRMSLEPPVFLTAIKACLQAHGDDLQPAYDMLQQVDQNSKVMQDALCMILIHYLQIFEHSPYGNWQTRRLALHKVELTVLGLEQNGFPIPHTLIVHIAHHFVRRGQYQLAIDFWKSHVQGTTSKLDFFSLLVCLRAYIGLQDAGGVQWVMDMAVKYCVTPDKQWFTVLRDAIAVTFRGTAQARCFCKAAREALLGAQKLRHDNALAKLDLVKKTVDIMQKGAEEHRVRLDLPQRSRKCLPIKVETGLQGLSTTPRIVARPDPRTRNYQG